MRRIILMIIKGILKRIIGTCLRVIELILYIIGGQKLTDCFYRKLVESLEKLKA